MRLTVPTIIAGLALAACDSPPSPPQDDNVVNATVTDQAFPSTATGNDIVTGSQSAGDAAGAGNATNQQ